MRSIRPRRPGGHRTMSAAAELAPSERACEARTSGVAQPVERGPDDRPGTRTCRSRRFRTRAGATRTLAQRDARFGQLLLAPTLLVVLVVVIAADPVDGRARLPGSAADRPAQAAGSSAQFTLDNFNAVLQLARVLDAAAHHPALHVVGTVLVDRPRPRRRAGAARAVPGPHLRARVDAAAVRGAGRRGHLRLADDARPAVRHRQRDRHATCFGWDDPIAFLSSAGGRHLLGSSSRCRWRC